MERSDVLAAHEAVGDGIRQHGPQAVGDHVARRQRGDVARAALEHRHVGGALVHECRQQGDGGGAAADDEHAPARDRHPVGPGLRVHDLTGEVVLAGEVDDVPRRVGEVAGGQVDEAGRVPHQAVPGAADDGPAAVGRAPLEPLDALAEVDALGDPVVVGGGPHVVADLLPRGDRRRPAPRPEREAQGVHVGVGADAGVAEQVPRAADRVARLEHGPHDVGAVLRQPAGDVDPRDAGPDDEDVDVERRRGGTSAAVCSAGSVWVTGRWGWSGRARPQAIADLAPRVPGRPTSASGAIVVTPRVTIGT